MASPNILQERSLAQQYRKPVLPLLLERVTYPPAMEYVLAGRQWIELLDLPESTWLPDLQTALVEHGVAPGPQLPTAIPTEAPRGDPVVLGGPTSFIGREGELGEVKRLLTETRMLT